MEKSKNEIREEILAYLKEHRPRYKTCALATSRDNVPRATPLMYYHHNSLEIWLSTDHLGGGKIENIRANPRVSLAIFDPVESAYGWDDTRGLQLWGEAEIITYEGNKSEFNRAWKTGDPEGALKAIGRKVPIETVKRNLIFIKVTPEKITFMDSKKKRGYKVIWTKE